MSISLKENNISSSGNLILKSLFVWNIQSINLELKRDLEAKFNEILSNANSSLQSTRKLMLTILKLFSV